MKKKAFLVGINTYPSCSLFGCVNDVLLMVKVLEDVYGFNRKDIKVLLNGDATRSNILSGLNWLVRDLTSGDSLFFHYSGHGSQIVVDDMTNTDEADGLDEIICPIDLDWSNPIRDHDLGRFFCLLEPEVFALVVLDCCHSGTGIRNLFNQCSGNFNIRNRFLPPPVSNLLSNPLIRFDDNLEPVFPTYAREDVRTHRRRFVSTPINNGNTVLIAACRDFQVAADALLGNRYHGALTYCLVNSLKKLGWNPTYVDLIKEVKQEVAELGFDQEPQLEGASNLLEKRIFFS